MLEKQNGETVCGNSVRAELLPALPARSARLGNDQGRSCRWSGRARHTQAVPSRSINRIQSVWFLHTLLKDKTKGLHEGPSYSKIKGWAYDFQRLKHIIHCHSHFVCSQ